MTISASAEEDESFSIRSARPNPATRLAFSELEPLHLNGTIRLFWFAAVSFCEKGELSSIQRASPTSRAREKRAFGLSHSYRTELPFDPTICTASAWSSCKTIVAMTAHGWEELKPRQNASRDGFLSIADRLANWRCYLQLDVGSRRLYNLLCFTGPFQGRSIVQLQSRGPIVFAAQRVCRRQPDADWWTVGLIHVTCILRRDPTEPANL
jgi:hypothetical protein